MWFCSETPGGDATRVCVHAAMSCERVDAKSETSVRRAVLGRRSRVSQAARH